MHGAPCIRLGRDISTPLCSEWAEDYHVPLERMGRGRQDMNVPSQQVGQGISVPSERMGRTCFRWDISTPLHSGWAKEYHILNM